MNPRNTPRIVKIGRSLKLSVALALLAASERLFDWYESLSDPYFVDLSQDPENDDTSP